MSYYTSYRHIAIDGAKPAPAPSQIAAIEAELQARLPASFLAFLQVANGGEIDYYCDVPDGSGGVEQMSFPGIFNADEGDFCDDAKMPARLRTNTP